MGVLRRALRGAFALLMTAGLVLPTLAAPGLAEARPRGFQRIHAAQPAPSLAALSLASPNGTAGVSGVSNVLGATSGSTLTISTNPSGLFSVNSGARTLSWSSGVTAQTYTVGLDETLAGASNTPRSTSLAVLIASAGGYTTGASLAATATIPHPTLLDNNAGTNETGEAIPNRPAWGVVGVDYPPGPPSAQVFKVLGVDSLPACAAAGYTPASHRIYIQTLPCTLDGWDFQDFTIDTQYASATPGLLTVRNSKYLATTSYPGQFIWTSAYDNWTDLLIERNLIDGAYNRSSFDGLIAPGGGNSVIQLNWIKRIPDDGIHVRSFKGVLSIESRWNLFEGIGGAWDSHGDIIQVNMSGGGGFPFQNVRHHGNTVYQPCGDAVTHLPSAMNTDFRAGDGPTGTDMTNPGWDHETVIIVCANHTGSNAGVQVYNYPGAINLEQVGDSTTTGTNTITNWQVDYNYVYTSYNATYESCCDSLIFNIIANAHRANVTYTIGTHNVKMRTGAAWRTTLP